MKFYGVVRRFPELKMNNLICWWKGHFYNIPKYKSDLNKFYGLNSGLIFKSKQEIEDFYNNHPMPTCFRCKKEIKS